jgi:hypothetical protein
LVKKISSSQSLVRERVRAPSHTRTARSQEVRLYKQARSSKRLTPKRGSDTIHRQLKDQSAQVEKRQKMQGIKPHTVGRDNYESRPKLENRENSRILVVQTREARLKSRSREQSELRRESSSRRHVILRTSPVRLRDLAFGRARR